MTPPRTLDEARAAFPDLTFLWRGQRLVMLLLACVLGVASAACFAVAAWSAVGFVLAAVKGFIQ